ncbi:hypothetical protein J2X56_003008 [Herbaspirillum sp. 1173]|uniref:hypothetical protein n=1 Tax=Herbaspirillum sp. 1173 TaxID=2817734 RepID=UPI0028658648|nr:hypothetical protein [Herbaspirillum sp. 1173]MDR6740984.1 hypothetical protein [Herbaspirillum sp. 1173]
MRFYFEDEDHEAGFVWLRIGRLEVIEVTSGLGSIRTRTEFQIRNAPTTIEGQMIVCRKAIAQFIREATGSKEMSISIFDDSIDPWKGQLFAVTPLDDRLGVS